MKQFLITAIAVCSFLITNAQEDDSDGPVNRREIGCTELKFNMGTALFELIEVSYERILNNDMGVGLSASYSFDEFSDLKGMILPYFRFYPSESRRAKGFFLEANTGLIFSEALYYDYSSPNFNYGQSQYENRVGFGLGVAAGGKFISKRGLFGEVVGGIGREFNDETILDFYPRVGINFGYRF